MQVLCYLFLGQPFQSEYVHLEDCRIRPMFPRISVDCDYSSTSLATGFQVAVHAMNQPNELYVTQTSMDRSTSTSVMVNTTGQYMISIFVILDGTGITGSRVEHMASLMLNGKQSLAYTCACAILNCL